MKTSFVALVASLAATVSAQGVTISLPSGVSIPSGVSLPSGVSVVTASATSTTAADANANNVINGRFNRRQNAGGITAISGLSVNFQQTRTAAAQQTNE